MIYINNLMVQNGVTLEINEFCSYVKINIVKGIGLTNIS